MYFIISGKAASQCVFKTVWNFSGRSDKKLCSTRNVRFFWLRRFGRFS